MLIVPKRIANARREQLAAQDYILKASELDDGRELVTIAEGMERLNEPKEKGQVRSFAEAIQIMERYSGKETELSVLRRKQLQPRSIDEKVIDHNTKLANRIHEIHKEDEAKGL